MQTTFTCICIPVNQNESITLKQCLGEDIFDWARKFWNLKQGAELEYLVCHPFMLIYQLDSTEVPNYHLQNLAPQNSPIYGISGPVLIFRIKEEEGDVDNATQEDITNLKQIFEADNQKRKAFIKKMTESGAQIINI